MYEIEISNEQSILSLNESLIREVAETVFRAERVESARLSIAFVDNPTMRELNVRHLNHDYDTDVLSFLLECHDSESSAAAGSELRGFGKSLEGEVVISAEMARECAAEFNWSSENELVLYLVHGLLHLVGYDDLAESERELMRSRERSILHTWDLNPHYADDNHAVTGGTRSSSDDEPPPASDDHGGAPTSADSTEDLA